MAKTSERVKLVCQECGKTFRVSPNASDPRCPKCGGVDWEVAEPEYVSSETAYGRTVNYDFAVKVF